MPENGRKLHRPFMKTYDASMETIWLPFVGESECSALSPAKKASTQSSKERLCLPSPPNMKTLLNPIWKEPVGLKSRRMPRRLAFGTSLPDSSLARKSVGLSGRDDRKSTRLNSRHR